ncbi:MAG: parallel beta-helix domain-containing protein [Ferruginibacter sp.]
MKKHLKPRRTIVLFKQFYWLILIMALSIVSCKKEIAPDPGSDESLSADELSVGDVSSVNDEETALRRHIPHVVVHHGHSIQAAVNRAKPGSIIFIEPGIYNEAILVSKPCIQLVGLKDKRGEHKEIIIQNPGDEEYGIKVTDEGDGFILKNVIVRNFEEYGVYLVKVDNFVLDHVKSINNKEYGLFPVFCNNGVIKYCSATGSSDTGIYVGQSTNIIVRFNVAFGNVSGFEIENCSNVSASWNESFNNTAGMLVFLLPELTVKSSSNILVTKNNIHHNNLDNFAPPDGGLETNIPPGSGMLILGADNVTIRQNTITNNNFVGIATVSTLILHVLGVPDPPGGYTDIEPNPDGTKIVHNVVNHNGSAPPPGLPLPGADLLWDGSGTNNCWSYNIFTSSYPPNLPACN